MKTIREFADELAAGRATSADLVQSALERIDDLAGEGRRAYITVLREQAKSAAQSADLLRRAGVHLSPLAGLPISVKDLFDVAGLATSAGSRVLATAKPAAEDAAIVHHLRAAGAVVMGRTNMTEFAYSGLGLNPHYDTPRNPWDRGVGRIPGGSSSGAAVSVTDAMAVAAVGSDTGGSVRIPAALCGLTGFKPTKGRHSMAGVLPLSTSLDTVGPLAPSVDCCWMIDRILAGQSASTPPDIAANELRLAVATSNMFDAIEWPVASAIQRALSAISSAGAQLVDLPDLDLNSANVVGRQGNIVAVEAYAWHRRLLELRRDAYDPRVATRMDMGRQASAASYVEALEELKRQREESAHLTQPFDAVLLPTVVVVAPTIAELGDDEHYFRMNALILRNTAPANWLNRCAITLPIHRTGEPPVGLMLLGETFGDSKLFAVARSIEQAVRGIRSR
jgi:aspartyl-tRNA(Asn)/glutamyl-tRNA(Gln) amidotransferase subunit A